MLPASPVIEGVSEVVYAKNQPQYNNLPAIKTNRGDVITRWRLNVKERLKVLIHGDIFLTVATFGNPLQPIKLEVDRPKLENYNE